MAKTALYRHHDADGALLYVGISTDPWRRMAFHRLNSVWFDRVVEMRCEWYATRDDALAAERRTIEAEAPTHNDVMSARKLSGAKSRGKTQLTAAGWQELAARGLTAKEAAEEAGKTYAAARKAAQVYGIKFKPVRRSRPDLEAAHLPTNPAGLRAGGGFSDVGV